VTNDTIRSGPNLLSHGFFFTKTNRASVFKSAAALCLSGSFFGFTSLDLYLFEAKEQLLQLVKSLAANIELKCMSAWDVNHDGEESVCFSPRRFA
jgi:hypothetical protein